MCHQSARLPKRLIARPGPLAETLGLRPLLAHCHLGLGALYDKLNQPEPARLELSAAVELFRSMDMTFWLSRAEAALTRVA